MLSDGRIFFGGVGTSILSVALVVAFGQAVSHEPRPRQSIPELQSQLQPIGPASVTPRAPLEPATEVQAATPAWIETAIARAPAPRTEVPAVTPVEPDKQPGIGSPIKKTDLRMERLKSRAERKAKKLAADRVRQEQKLTVSKFQGSLIAGGTSWP
jgi:hypothetical protein